MQDLTEINDYKIINHFHANDASQPLLSNQVRAIEQLDDNTVWLGTKEGINIVNLSNNNIKAHQTNNNKNSISFKGIGFS